MSVFTCLFMFVLYIETYLVISTYIWSPTYDTQTPSNTVKTSAKPAFFVGRISAHFRTQHSYLIARREKRKIPESKNLKVQTSQTFHIYGILQKSLDFWIFGALEFGSFGFFHFLIRVMCFCCFVLCFLSTFVVSNVFLRVPKAETAFRCTEKAEFTGY